MVSCAMNKYGWYDHACQKLISSREEYLRKAQGCLSYLMQECIDAMNELGFSWTLKYDKAPWEEQIIKLIEYKKKHGHLHVPTES
eukprot:8343865-Ditylum_brightwellii.AAC.1